MNTPNPLLPQGTIPPKPKSTLYVKILMIVGVHVVLLGGLLISGCNSKNASTTTPPASTSVTDNAAKDPMSPSSTDFGAPSTSPITAPAASSAPLPVAGSSTAMPAVSAPAAATVSPLASALTPASIPAVTPAATAPATPGSVYVIAKGDLLSTVAKKSGVSLKALEEANPGVDPKKLQIGQKLQIPAATPTVASAGSSSSSATDSAPSTTDASVYVVKSGDVLTKIAKSHGTTVKALEALNEMKTSSIRAGQRIKVPIMKVVSTDTAAPTSAAPSGMTPAPVVRAN